MAEGLTIMPDKELKFRFELKKQIPTTIRLTNTTNEQVAFKVKTTAPKKYCVKPNTGFVESGETQMVSVIMQAQREWPADINQCKDKFLVQSTASDGKKDFAELFAKGREGIKESKLRVSYVQPAPPPSPVPEGEEKDGEDRDVSGDNRALGRMFTNKPDFNTARSEATAARAMPEDVGTLQRELEKYRLKNESLTTDLNMALKNPASSAVRGFSLLHLLITAILAFFAGLAYAKVGNK